MLVVLLCPGPGLCSTIAATLLFLCLGWPHPTTRICHPARKARSRRERVCVCACSMCAGGVGLVAGGSSHPVRYCCTYIGTYLFHSRLARSHTGGQGHCDGVQDRRRRRRRRRRRTPEVWIIIHHSLRFKACPANRAAAPRDLKGTCARVGLETLPEYGV